MSNQNVMLCVGYTNGSNEAGLIVLESQKLGLFVTELAFTRHHMDPSHFVILEMNIFISLWQQTPM